MSLPIVLVHGIVASDRAPETRFWGRIPASLRRAGYQVFAGQTDSVASIASNARVLGQTIERVCRDTGSPKVLLVAHSKGGIESRLYLSQAGQAAQAAGLVTVCTPHGGAELADLVLSAVPADKKLVKKLARGIDQLFRDENPDLLSALHDLSTPAMAAFNRDHPDLPHLPYTAYHTVMASGWNDLLFAPTWRYLLSKTGPNDGIVSQSSANSGRTSTELSAELSHRDILDITGRGRRHHAPDLWVDIIRKAQADLS